MAIENRELGPGTKLIAKYKKEEYRAEVIAGEEGKVKYRLADGRDFKSLSSAGTAITGVACNGWRFWSLEGQLPAQTEKPKAERKGGSKGKARRRAKPEASENGAGKGKGPVACGDCGQEFETSREAADHMREEHNSQEAQAGEKA